MVKKSIVQTIRDKEMDRKDFLKYSGLAIISLVGLKGVVSILTSSDDNPINKITNSPENSRGFGSGKYGA